MAQEKKFKKIKIIQKRKTCQFGNIQYLQNITKFYTEETVNPSQKNCDIQGIFIGTILITFMSMIATLYLTNREEFVGIICAIYEVIIAIVSLTQKTI